MTGDWQTVIALGIVLLAVAVLVRQTRRMLRNPQKSGCSSCPSNSGASRVKSLPLVELQPRHKD